MIHDVYLAVILALIQQCSTTDVYTDIRERRKRIINSYNIHISKCELMGVPVLVSSRSGSIIFFFNE